MKINRFLILLLLLAIGIASVTNVCGDTFAYSTPSRVVVSGSSELSFAPDIAEVTVGVESVHSDLQTAVSENTTNMQNVINAVLGFGVNEDEITTTRYSVYEQREYVDDVLNVNHKVSNYIIFPTTKLDELEQMVETLTECGANAVGNIVFKLSNATDAYNQVLTSAIDNAYAKAQALGGGQLQIVEVSEDYSYSNPYYSSTLTKELTNAIESGNVRVSAVVRVVFEKLESLQTV